MIINGNGVDILASLNQQVDLVFADLPYGVTNAKFDKMIDPALFWQACQEALNPTGCVVLTAKQPFTSIMVASNLKWFRHEWIWKKSKPTSSLNCKIQPLPAHESVLVFSPKRSRYYPQYTYKPTGKIKKPVPYAKSDNYGEYDEEITRSIPAHWAYPQSIIEFNDAYHEKKAGLHPQQKPVGLVEYFIRTYSRPADLVLDPTAGSCTTAIAAMNSGRRWICIEKEVEFCRVGAKRVSGVVSLKVEKESLLLNQGTLF